MNKKNFNYLYIIVVQIVLCMTLALSSCSEPRNETEENLCYGFNNIIDNVYGNVEITSLESYVYKEENEYAMYTVSFYAYEKEKNVKITFFYENTICLDTLNIDYIDSWKDDFPKIFSIYTKLIENGTKKIYTEEEWSKLLYRKFWK